MTETLTSTNQNRPLVTLFQMITTCNILILKCLAFYLRQNLSERWRHTDYDKS